MSAHAYRSHRRWRHELVPLVAVFSLLTALASVFPFKAAFFKTAPDPVDADCLFHERHGVIHVGSAHVTPASCAFVELTAEEESRVLASARSAWQTDRASVRRKLPEMFAEALPAEEPVPVIGIAERLTASVPAVGYTPSQPPTDLRARSPAVLPVPPPEPERQAAFSREELLKLE